MSDKKPSEQISDTCSKLACERPWQGPLQAMQDWCEAVERHLDAEHERRAKFEKALDDTLIGVLGRIEALEKREVFAAIASTAPRLPWSPEVQRKLQEAAELGEPLYEQTQRLREVAAAMAEPGPEPPPCALAPPIPCSDRWPPEDERVMFFVPSEPLPRWRWRTGRYWGNGGSRVAGPHWQSDDTMVGDEAHEFATQQVTHWMPMPGDPT